MTDSRCSTGIEQLIEAEAKRRCLENDYTLEFLACQDRRFRHDDRRPWWQAMYVSKIEGEIERLEKAGFVVAPQPASVAQAAPDSGEWCQPMDCGKHTPRKFYLYFDDPDHGNMVFDNEAEARAAFERKNTAWNCYLFGALPLAAPQPLDPAYSVGNCGEARKTFSKIKELALNVKIEDVPRTLAHIARLCIDAGAAPPDQRHWTEDASHENGNYECRCCECDQMFIGHKRRVICKACSNLLTPSVSSTDRWCCPCCGNMQNETDKCQNIECGWVGPKT